MVFFFFFWRVFCVFFSSSSSYYNKIKSNTKKENDLQQQNHPLHQKHLIEKCIDRNDHLTNVAEKVVELRIGHILCKISDIQRRGRKLAYSAGNDAWQND
jgi:hypothetical protein